MLKGKSIVLRPVKDSNIKQRYDFQFDLKNRGDYFPRIMSPLNCKLLMIMCNFKLILIIILICISKNIYASDTLTPKYFPLAVGNLWVYTHLHSGNKITYIKSEITKDTVISNKKYFFYKNFYPSNYFDHTDAWVRVDSTTGSIYFFDPANQCGNYYSYDIQSDSLGFDQYQFVNLNCYNFRFKLTDTTGNKKKFVKFIEQNPQYRYIVRTFMKNLGLFYFEHREMGSPLASYEATLKGCKVNGTIWGDTTFVNISIISSEVPLSFILYQNYPNPFNPVTTIRYSLMENCFASLKIYDMLGTEIDILVNEKQNAGTYSVEWDASNFPSGIYFYKFQSVKFNETKRMTLIK